MLLLTEHVVDGHDTVGPGTPGVVDDGGVGLDPDPAATSGQPAVISGAGLALVEESQVGQPHGHHVRGVDVLVQRLLYQVLRLVPGQGGNPGVQEYQLEVEGGAEHEDVALHLDLGDAGGRQAVGHGHHADTGQGHGVVALPAHRLDLEVAGTVNHLVAPVGQPGISLGQDAFHPEDEGPLDLDVLVVVERLDTQEVANLVMVQGVDVLVDRVPSQLNLNREG